MNFDKLQNLEKEVARFRISQIFHEIFNEGISDWQESTTLPKSLRLKLNELHPLEIKHQLLVAEDNTTKAIITLEDQSKIEAVLIKTKDRNTVCVSSQVGCAMSCAFCATGTMGFKRNLTASEITEQVVLFQRILRKTNEKVTNVVFMGMGEPLLNLDNVLTSIDFLNQKNTLSLGKRRFSISTCGYIPGIERLAELDSDINLAISLHAATNKKRNQIMPVNQAFPLEKLSESLIDYYKNTKRKIMFEYIMIEDFNLSFDDAHDLAKYIHSLKVPYMVNLIPYNQTKHCDFKAPNNKTISIFKNVLGKNSLDFVQRKEYGSEVAAACGQLVKDDSKKS